MTKGGAIGRLAKLKCMMKRWQQQTKAQQLHQHLLYDDADADAGAYRTYGNNAIGALAVGGDDENGPPEEDMHTVLVGKTRRKYTITSNVVHHPLFRILVQRSSGCSDQHSVVDKSEMVVCCEVVLFQHLLWMLENADPQPDSLDELVEFYAC